MPRAAATENELTSAEFAKQRDDADFALVGDDPRGDTPLDVGAIFRLPEVRAQMQGMVQEAVKQAVRETVLAMNPSKPSLTLRANVADRFITGSNNPSGNESPHLKHYRCERLKSDKIVEYDMKKLMSYLNEEKELPETKDGNTKSMFGICVKQGSFISFLNGHCYAYTENQVQQLEWLKTQPRDKGGLPDLYEDAGGEVYRCQLCPGSDPFGSKEGFNRHMYFVHGVVNDATPAVVPPMFANTSPDPFNAPIR